MDNNTIVLVICALFVLVVALIIVYIIGFKRGITVGLDRLITLHPLSETEYDK